LFVWFCEKYKQPAHELLKAFVFSILNSCQSLSSKTLADFHFIPNITAAVDEWPIYMDVSAN